MQIVKWVLATIIGLVLSAGCQKDRPEAAEEPLDQQYQLIDKGDYSQAILGLQQLSQRDSRPQVRVALASAYAARGGIKVSNYWGFVVGFKNPLLNTENGTIPGTVDSLQRISAQLNGKVDPKDLKALGGLVNAAAVWDRYKDRVDAIPVVRGEALRDVATAVEVLSTVQTPGGRLYRAILNLILFKSFISNSGSYWEDFSKAMEQVLKGQMQSLCKFDLDVLQKWMTPVFYHLLETLNDLIIAYPKDAKELTEARNTLRFVQGMTVDSVKELRQKRVCP